MINQHTTGPDPVIGETCEPAGWPVDEAPRSVRIGGILYTFPTAAAAARALEVLRILDEAVTEMEKISRSSKILHLRSQFHIVK